ncbi:ERCC4 domain-containing protein [Colletotrichum graminicola]|uniref:ERCC4 domain-containing protein n=1 Tax=Colletotrichum graminicola (strain M1.001 / M2 / FGSC 10212) TaxID=645133 RepID=E3QZM8_COLGM|nr:ERCC4 domain-containing protein [Colletotrichum graminicola M1.001]EFQ36316.1 ERCC4 domain-containing protein [Colletotrichum graminicola M1.001]WDK10265.1 ERCC4 domain-containing protein [Colletotrichum graminicola]
MPVDIISLLSSPSFGPSLDRVEPSPSHPPIPATINVDTRVSAFDNDDVFDLTADSPEAAPRPPSLFEEANTICSPVTGSGAKRPREEQAPIDTLVYFNSDDFDTTIDLESSLPIANSAFDEPRDTKRPRLSPLRRSRSSSPSDRSLSVADQLGRPPVKPSGGPRRIRAIVDPIEFSSSPGIASRPVLASTTANERLESDDPSTALPPSAQPVLSRQSPERPTVASGTRVQYDLTSDPFAISPHPPLKPAVEPCTIILDDDDDDPFASSPQRAPVQTMKPAECNKTGATREKGKQKAASPRRKANWDPISSSAPEPRTRTDPFDSSSPPPPRKSLAKAVSAVIDLSNTENAPPNLHTDSDEEFPDLENFDLVKLKARLDTRTTAPRTASKASSKTTTKSTSARIATKTSTEDKARQREAKAAEREQEKERKKQEKEVAKEQKAREKERAAALAEVNKIRTDKKVSTPEMIADLPASLSAAVTLQIQTLLKDLDVQHTTWDSPVDNVVKWRRKVASKFNDELGHWEPIPMRVEPEKFALVIVTANDFVTCALGPEGNDLEAHALKMKRHFPQEQLIYLIEGLNPWMRKNRNVRNRQFASAVRSHGDDAPDDASTSRQPRRRKNQQPQEYVDEDSIEDALLQLQVMHGALIHHTNAAVETAQWIAIFTQHISTVPYRKQREATNAAGAGFCMETGQVRTGEDVKDTYVRMLQEIVRVTQPVAYGIVSEFGTVPELVKALEERGPLCLENCRKSTNKDGGFSDRAVGKAISKRVYKVFTGRDEWSTDV